MNALYGVFSVQVGNTGLSTAPHLHWGLYVGGEAIDPAPWMEVPKVSKYKDGELNPLGKRPIWAL